MQQILKEVSMTRAARDRELQVGDSSLSQPAVQQQAAVSCSQNTKGTPTAACGVCQLVLHHRERCPDHLLLKLSDMAHLLVRNANSLTNIWKYIGSLTYPSETRICLLVCVCTDWKVCASNVTLTNPVYQYGEGHFGNICSLFEGTPQIN